MKTKQIFMVYCPKCHRENYLPAVASGECAWCGYIAQDSDINGGDIFTEETERIKNENKKKIIQDIIDGKIKIG